MENLFNNKEKYELYVSSKKNSLKERYVFKELFLFGEKDVYERRIYDVNNFENMPREYGIKLEYYRCKDETKKYWDIIKVSILKKGKTIFSFIRDYSSISMCYAKVNGMDYIIFTGEHYQGFSIYNLSKESFYSYIPTGGGWCPMEIIEYDEDFNELRTYGCYWGCGFSWRNYKIEDLDNPSFDIYEEIDDD